MAHGHLPIRAGRQDSLPLRKDLAAGENLNAGGFSVFEGPATSGSSFPMAGGMDEEAQMFSTPLYSKPGWGLSHLPRSWLSHWPSISLVFHLVTPALFVRLDKFIQRRESL